MRGQSLSIRKQFTLLLVISNGMLLVCAVLLMVGAHVTQIRAVDDRDTRILMNYASQEVTTGVPASDSPGQLDESVVTPPMKLFPVMPQARASEQGASVKVSPSADALMAIRLVKEGLLAGYERIVFGGFLVIILLNVVFTAWFIRRTLEEPLHQAALEVARMAAGDYRIDPHPASSHEVRQLRHHLFLLSDALRRAENLAAQTEQQRRTLISGIGHDLATPLTNIQGYAETLMMELEPATPDAPLALYADIIQRNARQANLLMKGLLQANRPESGYPSGDTVRVEVTALLAQLADDLGQAARTQRQSFHLTCPEPIIMEIDETSLRRMVTNVMQNFLHHAGEGTVMTITAGRSDEGVDIRLSDNGIGVPAQTVHRLTDLMYRGDAARNNRQNSGLGLYVTARLAERLQADMTLESDAGKGLSVTFHFPA